MKGRNRIQAPGLTMPDTNSIVSSLTHDLRSPLNSIIGFSEILLSERIGKLNQDQYKQMEIILRRGSELLTILDQLVDYCKNINHETEVQRSLLGLVPFLSCTAEKLKKLLPEESVTLSFDPPSESIFILGDEKILHQVLEHLTEVGLTLFKPRKIEIQIHPDMKKRDSRSGNNIRVDMVFKGSWNQNPNALLTWDRAIDVPGRVRFFMHLSRLYISLMGGGLTASKEKGRIVFHLDICKEEL
jgi:hypothetical protein